MQSHRCADATQLITWWTKRSICSIITVPTIIEFTELCRFHQLSIVHDLVHRWTCRLMLHNNWELWLKTIIGKFMKFMELWLKMIIGKFMNSWALGDILTSSNNSELKPPNRKSAFLHIFDSTAALWHATAAASLTKSLPGNSSYCPKARVKACRKKKYAIEMKRSIQFECGILPLHCRAIEPQSVQPDFCNSS